MGTRKNNKRPRIHLRKTRSKRQRGGAEDEDNALLEASSEGKIDRVKELLEKGADVNAKDEYDSTALIKASEAGDPEVVRMLLENEADVNAKTMYGSTMLKLAILQKHTEIVDLLEKYIQRHEDLINYRRLRIKALNPE